MYVETYGCQMNVNDSEVMMAVLEGAGYDETKEVHDADVILINTCAIRDKAEAKIWQRLAYFRSLGNGKKRSEKPVVGVLGCMAERIKEKLLEADRLADIVAGPDAYRDLPNLIDAVVGNPGGKAMNVQLSAEETYADIIPVREAGRTRLSSPSCAGATTRARFASCRTRADASARAIWRASCTRFVF